MSWWETSSGSTIGDEPADILRHALQAAATDSHKPTVPDLLAATGAALKGGAGKLVSDDGAKAARLVAVLADGGKRISASAGGQPPAPVATAMSSAFEKISRAYTEQLERKPTTKELLEGMAFVLRYKPDELLSGVDGQSIDEIVIDAAKS